MDTAIRNIIPLNPLFLLRVKLIYIMSIIFKQIYFTFLVSCLDIKLILAISFLSKYKDFFMKFYQEKNF